MNTTDTTTRLDVLSEDECWHLLETHGVGRLVVATGRQPDIFPVNYVVAERLTYIRTAPGTKLSSAVLGGRVAFEIDEIDPVARTGWSVVLHGRASEVTELEDSLAALDLGLDPWDTSEKHHFIRISADDISGRRLTGSNETVAEVDDPPGAPPHHLHAVSVPMDASPTSARAVPWAQYFARALGVPVSVTSVVQSMRSDSEVRMQELDEMLAGLGDDVERTVVQSDLIGHAIADDGAGSLICMATSASLFDGDSLKGSMAELVVASSSGPVIVIGPKCDPSAAVDQTGGIDRVVVALDPRHRQSGLTVWATRVAYGLGLPVDFVHVDTDGASVGPRVRRLQLADGESVAQRLAREARGALLAIGSHGRIGLARLAEGSVGGSVFRHAEGPVLVLGPKASA